MASYVTSERANASLGAEDSYYVQVTREAEMILLRDVLILLQHLWTIGANYILFPKHDIGSLGLSFHYGLVFLEIINGLCWSHGGVREQLNRRKCSYSQLRGLEVCCIVVLLQSSREEYINGLSLRGETCCRGTTADGAVVVYISFRPA